MIKEIIDNNILYARIIRSFNENQDNVFYTEENDALQLGSLTYEKGYKTGAHYHNINPENKNKTDEIIIVQSGSLRIDFFANNGLYLKSVDVSKGDIAIIYQGGHNIFYYEQSKILLIKNGPYEPSLDKTRIVGANNLEIKIEN